MVIDDARNFIPAKLKNWLESAARGSFQSSDIRVSSGPVLDVLDPGTGLALTSLSTSTPADVSAAVAEARVAFEDGRWSDADADHRETVLSQLADLVRRDFDLLVTLEALDTGKPKVAAEMDVAEAEMVIRYYAGWCNKITGSTIAAPRNLSAATYRGPVGVCAAITPWNYPLPILTYKLAPALAFGNSLVVKPSELAPLSTIYLAELCREAGVPDRVLSVVIGSGSVGALLVEEPGLDKIAFTGSTATGQAIMKSAASNITRVSLELGGKSPQVVFASADLDSAVAGVADGIWTNSGQVCVAGSRLIIEESIREEFVSRLIEHTEKFVLGHSLDESSMMGPMISAGQLAKTTDAIEGAALAGAKVTSSGTVSSALGFFLKPTIIEGLSQSHSVNQKEVFGPVLTVDTFRSESEAIEKANGTEFGLAAGVWTGAAGQGQRLARKIRAGTVWVNTYGIFHPTLPFGGTKASGFGRELGESGVDAFTEVTSVIEDIAERTGRE
jgi:acyl-CoA reductase-like NAD-dependent aldehyde dehydrogenase